MSASATSSSFDIVAARKVTYQTAYLARPKPFDWCANGPVDESKLAGVDGESLRETLKPFSVFRPGAKLELKLYGEHLDSLDVNGYSDPYARINFMDENENSLIGEIKTKVCKKTLDPNFGVVYNDTVPDELSKAKFIKVELFDKDLIGKDEYMGTAFFEIAPIASHPEAGSTSTYAGTAYVFERKSTVSSVLSSDWAFLPDRSWGFDDVSLGIKNAHGKVRLVVSYVCDEIAPILSVNTPLYHSWLATQLCNLVSGPGAGQLTIELHKAFELPLKENEKLNAIIEVVAPDVSTAKKDRAKKVKQGQAKFDKQAHWKMTLERFDQLKEVEDAHVKVTFQLPSKDTYGTANVPFAKFPLQKEHITVTSPDGAEFKMKLSVDWFQYLEFGGDEGGLALWNKTEFRQSTFTQLPKNDVSLFPCTYETKIGVDRHGNASGKNKRPIASKKDKECKKSRGTFKNGVLDIICSYKYPARSTPPPCSLHHTGYVVGDTAYIRFVSNEADYRMKNKEFCTPVVCKLRAFDP